MTDHFALASSVGTAAVHWASDGGSGSNIFLSVYSIHALRRRARRCDYPEWSTRQQSSPNPGAFAAYPRRRDLSRTEFAADSPLEGDGFELSVPRQKTAFSRLPVRITVSGALSAPFAKLARNFLATARPAGPIIICRLS
jgi:hypothetical protein